MWTDAFAELKDNLTMDIAFSESILLFLFKIVTGCQISQQYLPDFMFFFPCRQ